MTLNAWFGNPARLLVSAMMMLVLTVHAFAEWKEKVLYSFQGGSDGYTPAGGVVFDKAGNLYGANSWGGSGGCTSPGCGTVFEISPPAQKGGAWTETTIYAFQGVTGAAKDGLTPEGGLIIDSQGNLYGTTSLGGSGPCILLGSPAGCGVVYQLSPPTQKSGQWTETILYNFQGGNDGDFPIGDLVFDKHGNLYGSTWYGGGQGNNCDVYYGGNCGTVFKLSPPKKEGGAWTEKILYSFAGVANDQQVGDGADPNGGLVLDSRGAIYGTTYYGGNNQAGKCKGSSGATGCGTVFKLAPPTGQGGTWKEKLLYLFQGGQDAVTPGAGVTFGMNGDLYGTTVFGPQNGYGTIFEVVKPSGKSHVWKDKLLYLFGNGKDGNSPRGSLIPDSYGNLYGTARDGDPVSGTVFRLMPPKKQGGNWTFSVLYGFTGAPDGANPTNGLIFDKQGNIYSTTENGGTGGCFPAGCGTVLEVRP